MSFFDLYFYLLLNLMSHSDSVARQNDTLHPAVYIYIFSLPCKLYEWVSEWSNPQTCTCVKYRVLKGIILKITVQCGKLALAPLSITLMEECMWASVTLLSQQKRQCNPKWDEQTFGPCGQVVLHRAGGHVRRCGLDPGTLGSSLGCTSLSPAGKRDEWRILPLQSNLIHAEGRT